MERSESVYRRDHERTFPATSGGLALPVSRLQKRGGVSLSGLHCRTMRTETTNGQHNHFRTRIPRNGDHDSRRGSRSGSLEVSGSKHDSAGEIVSAFADIVVSAFVEIPGQHLLTLSRKDIQKGNSLFWRTAESLFLLSAHIQKRTAKRLTAAVRNRTQSNAGFKVSASVVVGSTFDQFSTPPEADSLNG
jgi:hypothetical protein